MSEKMFPAETAVSDALQRQLTERKDLPKGVWIGPRHRGLTSFTVRFTATPYGMSITTHPGAREMAELCLLRFHGETEGASSSLVFHKDLGYEKARRFDALDALFQEIVRVQQAVLQKEIAEHTRCIDAMKAFVY